MSRERHKLVAYSPTIDKLTISAVDTDEAYTIPVDTKRFDFYNRSGNDLKYAFNSGDIANGNYRTLPAGAEGSFERIKLESPLTIYFQSASTDTIEIEIWK